MPVAHALVDERITEHLTPEGVQQVLASLWPVDCQTCGRPLGSKPPSLAVDDLIINMTASLCHPRCRPSVWNDDQAIPMSGAALLSFTTTAMILPMGIRGEPNKLHPFFMVNPGLEMVFLTQQSSADRWTVTLPTTFTDAGMRPPGAQLHIDEPIPGAVAEIDGHRLTVTLTGPTGAAHPPFGITLDDPIHQQILASRGVMFIATHAVNPAEVTRPRQLDPVFRGDRTLFGWVELTSYRR